MLDKINFQEWIQSISAFLGDQVWFQQLKGKWEELDPQSRTYVKYASMGGATALSFIFVLSFILSVHHLKNEVAQKTNLLTTIQNANSELKQLRETMPPLAANSEAAGSAWAPYLESLGAPLAIDKASINLTSEKGGISNEQSKEVLITFQLKHINIKQLVRFISSLESGQRPVKLRNLAIADESDLSGYIDAVLAISGFSLVHQQ